MTFEEYLKTMTIQYNLLQNLYFDDSIIGDKYTIYKSNTITDNFWNIAILNSKDSFDDRIIVNNIEEGFDSINREACIYLPRMIDRYTEYKDYLIDNGYSLNDVDSYMVLFEDKINVEIKETIKFVETKEQFDDFMAVMESAYGGEITPENPYAGSITKEYYEVIFKSLGNRRFNHIILYKDAIPVSIATLSYENGYGVINNVGTKKEFQNLGLGKQLMRACIDRFNELGGGTLFLATEHESKNEEWYIKLGFKTLFINEQYIKNRN